MDIKTLAKELTTEAAMMEQRATAMRNAADALVPMNGKPAARVTGKRRGRPPGSKNRPKVAAAKK